MTHKVPFEWKAIIPLAQQVVHSQEKVGVGDDMAVEAEYLKNDLDLPILPPLSVLSKIQGWAHHYTSHFYIILTGRWEGDVITIILLIP